jgi:hypothetical protein
VGKDFRELKEFKVQQELRELREELDSKVLEVTQGT